MLYNLFVNSLLPIYYLMYNYINKIIIHLIDYLYL